MIWFDDEDGFATWMKPLGIRAPPCTNLGTRKGSGFWNISSWLVIVMIMIMIDHRDHDLKGTWLYNKSPPCSQGLSASQRQLDLKKNRYSITELLFLVGNLQKICQNWFRGFFPNKTCSILSPFPPLSRANWFPRLPEDELVFGQFGLSLENCQRNHRGHTPTNSTWFSNQTTFAKNVLLSDILQE